MIPREKWKYKGFPGHFNLVHKCKFRLCTDVGSVRISTVGAYYEPGDDVMQEIGSGRHYESYVFKIEDGEVTSLVELDSDSITHVNGDDPYETDKRAEAMHDRMCVKWARKVCDD